jgi:hypothetical protein
MITSNHFTDSHGRPAGGSTYGRGFAIAWQHGPLKVEGQTSEPNGAFVEDVITAALDRIEHYQSTEFRNIHNHNAIRHLKHALKFLNYRTEQRRLLGIEGTHQK